MIILIGASASGKTEISMMLVKQYGFKKVVTYTTRLKRHNEIQDVDYHFVSEEQFLNMKNNNEFIETIYYQNHYYGTSFKDLGGKKVLIVDPNGANVYFDKLGDKAVFFLIEAEQEIRKQRMINRNDREEEIIKRLAGDKITFQRSNIKHIDFIINNNNDPIEQVTMQIYSLYRSKIHDI